MIFHFFEIKIAKLIVFLIIITEKVLKICSIISELRLHEIYGEIRKKKLKVPKSLEYMESLVMNAMKSTIVKAEVLLKHATANTWPIGNSVGSKKKCGSS